VEAEFILIKDGKIHLHKVNGVKIAVPVTKMSVEDLEYVERVTGESLDDDKPLSDLKRRSTLQQRTKEPGPRSPTGISVQKKPNYDWFDFFLKCGVNPQICERYARAFAKDEMTEDNIPDITPALLRTLGLKEGDILRVTKHLEAQSGGKREDGGEGSSGGLFSGPGGALRNNTRKGRPAPPVETNNAIDAKAFEQKSDGAVKKPAEATSTPLASAPTPDKTANGFDDNAWDVKPSRSVSGSAAPPAASPPPAQAAPPAAKPPQLTGSMNDLSLLDMPALKPDEIAQPAAPAPQPAQAPVQPAPAPAPAPAQQPQPTGATPTLFEQVAAIKALTQPQNMVPPRLRPQAPQQQNTGGLIAPPPQRSSSAPQNPQQSAFGPPPPLQPQLTGFNPNMMAQPTGQGQMQPQMTGFPQQNGGYGFQQNGMMPQPTGYNSMSPPPQQPMQTGFAPFQQGQPTGFQQPMQTGFQQPMQTGYQNQSFTQGFGNGSPFADPPRAPFQPLQAQPTGYNSFQPSPLNPQATGVNRFLPPALAPQQTGFMPTQYPPPVPPMPPMPSMQPLMPQKTGPPPSIKFGVQAAKKLTPQPTGKASLANASMYSPFVIPCDVQLTNSQLLKTPSASKSLPVGAVFGATLTVDYFKTHLNSLPHCYIPRVHNPTILVACLSFGGRFSDRLVASSHPT
jgi:hypothetical protein